MKKTALLTLIILCAWGCQESKHQERTIHYNGVPSSAIVIAENEEWTILLNDEAVEDSIEGLPSIKQVSLWVYDKNRKEGKKILLSHPNTNMAFLNIEHSVSIPLDSIPTITKVIILSWPNESLKLLVEGCSDYRNVKSFIISEDSANAICLPTNRGLIGISEEDGLLIMQSYDYYEDGGRNNIIEAFDVKGLRVSSMNAKTRN